VLFYPTIEVCFIPPTIKGDGLLFSIPIDHLRSYSPLREILFDSGETALTPREASNSLE
jgi:hypothetical protein